MMEVKQKTSDEKFKLLTLDKSVLNRSAKVVIADMTIEEPKKCDKCNQLLNQPDDAKKKKKKSKKNVKYY